MSSSESRIIKSANVSKDPVVIAMQKFSELDVAGLEQYELSETAPDDGVVLSEPITTVAPEDEIIQAARAEAENIIENAKCEADKLRAQATQAGQDEGHKQGHATGLKQGLDDGLRQGLEEARQQMAGQLREAADRSNALVAVAQQEVDRLLAEAEPKIIELVLAISRKVIYEEVAERPTVVLNLVRGALERVRDQDKINIHVSPDDYDLIMQARRDLQGVVGAERSLTVSADPVLERGGCLIETSFGTVEAGIDTQLEAIRQALQELLP